MSSTATIDAPKHAAEEDFRTGIYLTDGRRLFRVVAPRASLHPAVDLEDCLTLEVQRYFSDELDALSLRRVATGD